MTLLPRRVRLPRRQSLLRACSVALLLFAVLPNIMQLGHSPAEGQHTHDALHSDMAETDEHALHCHTGGSQCGSSLSLVGVWWIGDDGDPIQFDGALQAIHQSDAFFRLNGLLYKFPHPPKLVA